MARRLRCLESVQERRNPARTAPCERVRDLHSPCLQLRRQPYPYRLGLPRCWRRAAPSGLPLRTGHRHRKHGTGVSSAEGAARAIRRRIAQRHRLC